MQFKILKGSCVQSRLNCSVKNRRHSANFGPIAGKLNQHGLMSHDSISMLNKFLNVVSSEKSNIVLRCIKLLWLRRQEILVCVGQLIIIFISFKNHSLPSAVIRHFFTGAF